MDIQRTMEFILEQQAAVSASIATLAAGQQRSEAWQAKADKRFDALATLTKTGMKLLARHEKGLNQLSADVKELAAAQKRTEKNLELLIETMRKGRNGHSH